MSETTKKEITKIEPVRDFDVDTELVTYVKADGIDDTKNGIIFLIPSSDEEAQERYNCSMAFLVRAGVRNLSHHITYEGNHDAMQTAADVYKVGTRGTGAGRKTIKKVEKERDAALAVAMRMGEQNGMDEDAIKAMVEEYNAEA